MPHLDAYDSERSHPIDRPGQSRHPPYLDGQMPTGQPLAHLSAKPLRPEVGQIRPPFNLTGRHTGWTEWLDSVSVEFKVPFQREFPEFP